MQTASNRHNLILISSVNPHIPRYIEQDAHLAELQQQCYDAYAQLQTAVAEAESEEAAAQAATEISANTAEAVHTAIVEMVNSLQ